MNPWIKENKNGECDENAVLNILKNALSEGCTVLAFFADRFQACRGDQASELLKEMASLLEVRAFDSKQELWFHRSTLGAPFAWRLADESGCVEGEDYFDTVQALDIDETYGAYKNGETDEYGCLKLRSTVKGCYALPIEKNDGCVKVINYIRYDENGIAGVADYRIAGFAPLRKEGM